MSFGGFERGQSPSQPMAEINVTPLVDVMLVLLVIFIITAPLLAYALRLDLPDVKAAAAATRPDTVKLAIEADGTLRWNDERIDDAQLTLRLQESAKKQPQPELHLLADKGTRYEAIARVMSAAQLAGITKLGFVTDPPQAADEPAAAAVPAPAKP
jgi:biopolymer transport protein ExbD